jgi:hypothetical protein
MIKFKFGDRLLCWTWLQIVAQSNPSQVRIVLTANVHVLQITAVVIFFLGRTYCVGTDFVLNKLEFHDVTMFIIFLTNNITYRICKYVYDLYPH